MNLPDLINGGFEFGGSLAVLTSVFQLWKDKEVKGVNPWMVCFFAVWATWGLYWYWFLGQWASWIASFAMSGANVTYFGMMWYYLKFPGGKGS